MEAAALLHDVDKLPAVNPLVANLPHAQGSAAWLAQQGFPELGPVIVAHPVTRLAEGEWFDGWLATASPEELIVCYADKRAGQRLESMAERFASWERRYPPEEGARRARGSWSAATVSAVRQRAEKIEERVCALADVAPKDVRRLRWTGPALEAYRRVAP